MIGPRPLVAWVRSSCPFLDLTPGADEGRLADLAAGPHGYRRVLAAGDRLAGRTPSTDSREDYLALCLAAHHATVGSYVPTDVDGKIRGDLWRRAKGATLHRRWALAVAARGWSTDGVSTRVETTADGPVSGHDGEWFGVAVGALGAALLANDRAVADASRAWIEDELAREARAFAAQLVRAVGGDPQEAVTLARLAWILTHNVGDIDQGLSYWPASDPRLAASRLALAELSHERPERFAGTFHHAKRIYQTVAAEGHRHYPLREAKCLRRSAALLLPLGPCLEAWGTAVATSPDLGEADRAEFLGCLLTGIDKVRGQVGYQRALVGLAGCRGGLRALARHLPATVAGVLERPDIRDHLALDAAGFAGRLATRVRAAADLPPTN